MYCVLFSSYTSLLRQSQSLNQMFIKLRYVIAYFIGKTTVQESIYIFKIKTFKQLLSTMAGFSPNKFIYVCTLFVLPGRSVYC